MEIPSRHHRVWSDLVSGTASFEFEFLAARILLSTLARAFAKDPSAGRLDKCAGDLRELFARNADLPSVRKDLQRLFG